MAEVDSVELFEPQYEGAIQAYTKKTIKTHLWRIQRVLTFQDMLQESYVVFLQLKQRYTGTDSPAEKRVDNAAWFMSLYKTALNNRITDMANLSRRREAECPMLQASSGEHETLDFLDVVPGDLENEGILLCYLEQLPEEAAAALRLLLTLDHKERLALERAWLGRNKKHPFGNAHFAELLGLERDPFYKKNPVPILEQLKQVLFAG